MITVIINPISGSGRRAGTGAERMDVARRTLAARRVEADVRVTEGPGHAAALASEAVRLGATTVAAWGGDGTVNEVGGALVGTAAALAVVPAGSGNGFARALGVTVDAAQALDVAANGATRSIDVGVLNDRFFFNVAGIGFDAHVARRFNQLAAGRRGLLPYLSIGVAAGLSYRSQRYTIRLADEIVEGHALVVALANAPQYGYGATIAPAASVDDGVLDLVVVQSRVLPIDVWRARRLFTGTIAEDRHVTFRKFQTLRIEAPKPMEAHADGEVVEMGTVADVTVRPGALRVKMPR